jgi:hypothetical protein
LDALAIRAKRDRKVLEHPTSPDRASSRRRVTIFCAEAHRPAACCVEDALVARGWTVALETGSTVRPELSRLLRTPNAGLLVLCVPQRLDAGTAARIRARVDPEGRADLLVASIETPRSVIEAVERAAGSGRRIVRRARRPHSVLAHPTLVEQQVGPSRAGWFAIGAAAVLVLGALGLDTRRPAQPDARASLVQPNAPDSRSPLLDDTVFSAASAAPLDPEPEPRSTLPALHRRVRVKPAMAKPAANAPEIDAPLHIVLEPAPLEEALERSSASPHRSGVPGIRKPYALDPFADSAHADHPLGM